MGNTLIRGPKKLCLCFQNLLNNLCSCAQKFELLNSVTSYTLAGEVESYTDVTDLYPHIRGAGE